MTLQQKLLAKQSKKGFTLVELVVVIAILGILAAIAIPAVIGIINSANESQGKTDAASLSNACKTYFAGIVAGQINSTAKGKSSDTLPAATASNSAKASAALACTVQGACEYNGLTDLQNKIGDFVADTNTGTIYYKDDNAAPKSGAANYHAVAYTDTLSALGYTASMATSS